MGADCAAGWVVNVGATKVTTAVTVSCAASLVVLPAEFVAMAV